MDISGDTYFMRALLERIDKMIEEKSAKIIYRGAISYDDYLAQCESILTLKAVASACIDIKKQMLKEQTRPTEEVNPVLVHKQRRA
jgi:hypothetical protein